MNSKLLLKLHIDAQRDKGKVVRIIRKHCDMPISSILAALAADGEVYTVDLTTDRHQTLPTMLKLLNELERESVSYEIRKSVSGLVVKGLGSVQPTSEVLSHQQLSSLCEELVDLRNELQDNIDKEEGP